MEFSANNTKNCAKQLEECVNRLLAAFRGEWEDEIRTSFNRYISLSKVGVDIIKQNANKIMQLCQELNALNVDQQISRGEGLCKDCDSAVKEAEKAIQEAERAMG